MRILHIISTLRYGGAERLVTDSIPIYQSKGYETNLAVLHDGKTDFRELLEKKSKGKLIFLTKGSVYNPLLILKLIPLLKKYDIIHAHLFPVLYWVVFAKILGKSKTPIIYTEHNTNNKRRNIALFKIIDRYVYRKLDFIGCISEGTLRNLHRHLLNSNLNLKVINNGIKLDEFYKFKKEKCFDYFDKNDFILIQISSFREQKDQLTLIQSLAYLPPSIKLLLVGDGHLKDKAEQFVNELKLNERVKFLGLRNDIPALLNYADVCVLSSHYEGFGLAILEGMASKKPSIASNIDGVKEIVEHYGLLFEKGNAKELASYIHKLYVDPQYYLAIANKCYERSKQYDINKMVNEYIEIYKRYES